MKSKLLSLPGIMCAAAILLLAAPSSALEAGNANTWDKEGESLVHDFDSPMSDGWATAQMAFWLIVVACMAYATVRLLRHLAGGKQIKVRNGIAEIVGQLPLSSKHNLFLVKFGRRLLLVGATSESINTLASIDDAGEVGEIVALVNEYKSSTGRLQGSLAQLARAIGRLLGKDRSITDIERRDASARVDAEPRRASAPGTLNATGVQEAHGELGLLTRISSSD